jgi:hypothetical protein
VAVADRSVRTPVLLAFLLSVGASGGALAYTVSQLATIGERLDALDRSYLPLAAVTAELGALTRQLDREQARGGRPGGAACRRMGGCRPGAPLQRCPWVIEADRDPR